MLTRTRIKICGITRLDDALLAATLGADALGFIFYRRSPRYIDPADARAIIDRLPPFVTPVAVLVDEPLAGINAIMAGSGCRVAQLHGDESPQLLEQLDWPVIKAISVASADDLARIANYPGARAILLDTKVTGAYGGTGVAFDWRIARAARSFGRPLILAGGLTPDNVADALRIAAPDMLDISSGVESAPGRKDPLRLQQFFATLLHAGIRDDG